MEPQQLLQSAARTVPENGPVGYQLAMKPETFFRLVPADLINLAINYTIPIIPTPFH